MESMKYLILILFPFLLSAQPILLLMDEATALPSNPHYTTNLASYWYYEDLAMDNSAVSSWGSNTGSTFNLTSTGAEQPTTTTNGVLFDGGDALTASTLAYVSNGNPYSIGIVCNIADTTGGEYQLLFGVRNTNILFTIGINSNGHLYAIGWDGTNYPEYGINSAPAVGQNTYIVGTYDGVNTVQLYIDGVLYADIHDGVNHQNGNTTEMGGDNTDNALYVNNGTLILAVEVYEEIISQENINANILYYQGLGDLP